VHNDYEWGCRDFLPSDQVAEQGFLFNDSLLVRVEVELRDDGPGQPLSVLTPPELKAHLAWAAENGLPRACLACLTTFACNNGASPEAKGVKASDHEALTAHLSTGAAGLISATCSEEWGTPLHLACIGWRPGNARVVTILLDCGAPVDALNKHGETPLVLAAREGGQTSVVATLLDRGGNPCLCSKGGWSPMSAAASRGRDDVVRLLAQRGAPLEEVWPPLSALLEAAKAGHASTALTLLESGADPEVQDEKGNTALWILLEKNMTEAALTMVQRHHASVAQCSRERSKVQRAKLLLKHAQRRVGKGAPGSKSLALDDGLDDDALGDDLGGDADVFASMVEAPSGKMSKKDAEAAALELVKELEEEEEKLATKSSKNKKKKDKVKAKKQQQSTEAEMKKKEQDQEKKDKEAAKKREDDERRNKERRELEERERVRREAAKLEWQKARTEERERSDQQAVSKQRQGCGGNNDGGGGGGGRGGGGGGGDGGGGGSDSAQAPSNARTKKRRNAGSGDGAEQAHNGAARSVLPAAFAQQAPMPAQAEAPKPVPSQAPSPPKAAAPSAAPAAQSARRQAPPPAQPSHSGHGSLRPDAVARPLASPWGTAPAPLQPQPSSAPSSSSSSSSAPSSSSGPGKRSNSLNYDMPPFPPPAAAAAAASSSRQSSSKQSVAIGSERRNPFPSADTGAVSAPLASGGWGIPASSAPVPMAPAPLPPALAAPPPAPEPQVASTAVAAAVAELGQLGSLLARHLNPTMLAATAPVMHAHRMDHSSFLMMSEPELFSLGLSREAVAALLGVQEEEVLSGVGGMGFMDDFGDDDGGGGGGFGGGMDFLLGGDDDERPPPSVSSQSFLDDGAPFQPPRVPSPPAQLLDDHHAPPPALAAPVDSGGVPESPALVVMRYEALKGMMSQMRDIEDRLAQSAKATVVAPSPPPAAASSRAKAGRAEDERDLKGFVFVCSSDTADEALETGVFGLPGSHADDLAEAVAAQTPIFLFNFSDGTLHGAWVADGRPGMNLSPTAFSSPNRTSSRFPAQLRVKRSDPGLHPHVTLRLDEEQLPFTSKLAGHWSWFGVPGSISKAHTKQILDKMREKQAQEAKSKAGMRGGRSAAASTPGQAAGRASSGAAGRSEGCAVGAALVSDWRMRSDAATLAAEAAGGRDPVIPGGSADEVVRAARAELRKVASRSIALAGGPQPGTAASASALVEEQVEAAAQLVAKAVQAARDKVARFAAEARDLHGHSPVAPEHETFRVASVPSTPAVLDGVTDERAGVVEVCWSPSPALLAAAGADRDGSAEHASLARSLPREYSTFVSVNTFRSLSLAYTERGHAASLFLPRLFELALMYESLALATTPAGGGFGAFELCLPEALVAAARTHFHALPVLASPLTPPGGLGTACARVDRCWGSVGAFNDLRLDVGSYLLHLPSAWTLAHAHPLCPDLESPLRLLLGPVARGLATKDGGALSFLVALAVPAGGSAEPSAVGVDPTLRPFLRRSKLVRAGALRLEARRLPSCASGPPRLVPSNPAAWASAVEAANFHGPGAPEQLVGGWAEDGGCDLLLAVLQNDAGSRAWPATSDAVEALAAALGGAAAQASAADAATARRASASRVSSLQASQAASGHSGGGGGGDDKESKPGGFSWAKVVQGGK